MKTPYEELVKLSRLTEKHRHELKTKRGFSDETIETLRFRSADQSIIQSVVYKWLAESTFSRKELVHAGILKDLPEKNPEIMPALISGQVLIPFLDNDRNTYFLRSHKMCLKGKGIKPYCHYLLKGNKGHVILTEGSIKAAAAWQLGFPAIGIDGISSFSGKLFPDLIEILRQHTIQKITVIFDNEVKDDPKLEKYKEDPNKRHDTDFWAIRMAEMLGLKGFEATVGRLPDEWRENGKVDIDSALAQGRSPGDLQQVIDSGLPPNEYLKSLSAEAQEVITLKKKSGKLLGQIRSVYIPKGRNEPKWKKIGKLIIDHFRDEGGQFYVDGESVIMSLDHQVFEIGNNLRFNTLLHKIANLNPTTAEGRFIWAEIKHAAALTGKKYGLGGWCHFDTRTKEVHVLLDPEKGSAIRLSQGKASQTLNGSPDIPVLLRGPEEVQPINFLPNVNIGDGINTLLTLIIDNLATDQSSRLLVTSYFLSSLLKDLTRDRAILKMSGKTASGKSTAADLFAYLFMGTSGLEISTLAARFSQAPILPFIILDNLENEDLNRGNLNFLLTSATGITKKKRAAGTNTDVVRERCESLVVVTAIEPFTKPELVNRTLEVEFDKQYRSPGFMKSSIHPDILNKRDFILSAVFLLVTERIIPALADGRHKDLKRHLDQQQPDHNKERCNEFLALMAIVAEALSSYSSNSKSAEEILDEWVLLQAQKSADQEESASQILFYFELLFKDLLNVGSKTDLKDRNENDRLIVEASARDLLEAFTRLAKDLGSKLPFQSAGQLMSRIHNDAKVLHDHGWTYKTEIKKIHGTRIHEFTRHLSPEEQQRKGELSGDI